MHCVDRAYFLVVSAAAAVESVLVLSVVIAAESVVAAGAATAVESAAGVVSSALGAQAANRTSEATMARRFMWNSSPEWGGATARETFASLARGRKLKAAVPAVNKLFRHKSFNANALG